MNEIQKFHNGINMNSLYTFLQVDFYTYLFNSYKVWMHLQTLHLKVYRIGYNYQADNLILRK